MTFDIKKFLKDTKAGPYGMIQESKQLKEHQEEYLQIAKDAGSFESAVERLEDYGVNRMLANQIASDVWTEEGDLKEYSWDDEGTDDPDREEMRGDDDHDRFWDLGGAQLHDAAKSLVDDGFDVEDIISFIKSHFH